MGGKPKAPVIVMPPPPAPVAATPPANDPVVQAAMPAPTPQESPTLRGSGAQRGSASQRGPAALAASMGMNNTVLTSPRGVPGLPTETRRSSLLGL